MTDPGRPIGKPGARAAAAQPQDRAGSALPADRFMGAMQFRPLVLDAAMGTRLCTHGLDLRCDDPALWNLTHPEKVEDVHRRDVAAGADAVVTNTFGANRFWLARFGRQDAVESTNRRAVELARRATGPLRYVLGGLGPTLAREAGAAAQQAAILSDAGVDALLFETFGAGEIEQVLEEVARSQARKIPWIVSLWEWPLPPGPLARRLLEAGACAIGLNCQPGALAAIAFAESMSRELDCPLLVKPSAGVALDPLMSPALLAAAVPRLLKRNVRLIGGCCGTTEDHVAAASGACQDYQGLRLCTPTGARS